MLTLSISIGALPCNLMSGMMNKLNEMKWLKARIMEGAEAMIARQWHCIYVSSTTNSDATIEDSVFSVQALLSNRVVNTFLLQQINTQQ
jgi:hypothetical protein